MEGNIRFVVLPFISGDIIWCAQRTLQKYRENELLCFQKYKLICITIKFEKYITKSYNPYMRKLCTKWFKKWVRKENLQNINLLESIENLGKGLSVASLGGNIFKIRVKRPGKGKSSGYRTIVVYKKEEKAVFLYGYGKNEKSNINKAELQYFKKLGSDLLALKTKQILSSIEKQILFDLEVKE